MKSLRATILLLGALALTACGGYRGQGDSLPPKVSGNFDPSKEALVFFKTNEKLDSGKLSLALFYIQKEGTSELHGYICTTKDNIPIGERLAPGRYVFVLAAGDILTRPVEPAPVVTYDPTKNLPLTPIEVKAGDVVYVGNIFVEGIGKKSARGRAEGIKYTVEDRSDLAKQALADYRPDLVSKLQTKLTKVLP